MEGCLPNWFGGLAGPLGGESRNVGGGATGTAGRIWLGDTLNLCGAWDACALAKCGCALALVALADTNALAAAGNRRPEDDAFFPLEPPRPREPPLPRIATTLGHCVRCSADCGVRSHRLPAALPGSGEPRQEPPDRTLPLRGIFNGGLG
ncbi:cell wall transcription factor ACE2-like isoform X3 [Babesia caballi]|uniref:Cell wall transcription factor ACE2-like isoform X3 n=1 Tax=Babesia caballi TaxID=5871 RepID=A0AAV4LSQ2_BABCB|nr:cell wall transcription factor ACE2-like isoform X3 [Babesia caballi]